MLLNTYSEDGRRPISELYQAYRQLNQKYGWIQEEIYRQKVNLPIFGFRTPKKRPSIWIIAGIHGEEPTGPNAIAININLLGKLGQKGIAFVLIPLCNPGGYLKNWRYPNEYRDWRKGKSVSDSEHLLINPQKPAFPKTTKPSSPAAASLTRYVLKTTKKHPPLFSLNLHEDEALTKSYLYSQGRLGAKDPIARQIVSIMQKSGIPLLLLGKTRFGEKIANGIVEKVSDGSIDELLASKKIIFNQKVIQGPAARTVIVVEIPTIGVSFKKRISVHSAILQALEKLYVFDY